MSKIGHSVISQTPRREKNANKHPPRAMRPRAGRLSTVLRCCIDADRVTPTAACDIYDRLGLFRYTAFNAYLNGPSPQIQGQPN
jgi:hypothetical protein